MAHAKTIVISRFDMLLTCWKCMQFMQCTVTAPECNTFLWKCKHCKVEVKIKMCSDFEVFETK